MFGLVRPCNGADDRQGQLPLAEIVADILAHIARGPAPVEQVVDDLETHAERIAIGGQRLDLRVGYGGDDAADLGRGLEQGGGLAANDLRVDRFGRGEILRGGELQHLPLGDGGGRVGEDIEHVQRAGFDHQLEGAGEEVIAHQHAGFVVPEQVGRGPPAPLAAFVDHIVMQERGGVDELHRRRQLLVRIALVAAHPGRGERHHRADALAASLHQMGGYLGDARRMFGCHAGAD